MGPTSGISLYLRGRCSCGLPREASGTYKWDLPLSERQVLLGLPPLNPLPCVAGNVYIHPTASIDSTAVVSAGWGGPGAGTCSGHCCPCPHHLPLSSQLGPNVSIGEGVTVGAGVRVRESIVLHGASLHVSGACLRESVPTPTLCREAAAPCILLSFTPGPHLCPEYHRGLGQHNWALGAG